MKSLQRLPEEIYIRTEIYDAGQRSQAICRVTSMLRARHVFKTVFIGDPATGKTSIVARHVSSSFKENYLPTIGAAISSKDYDYAGHSVTLMIWDIAGQDIFNRVREKYYGGASAAFIVYDVTRSQTFENTPKWFEDMKKFIPGSIQMTLVGNKIDLPREVEKKEGEKLAKAIGADFIETSAKTGENIETAFANLSRRLLAPFLPSQPKKKGK
jgi:small GTP-binding protein